MREHLQSPLQFVRLTTLSHDEIIKEVMTTKILTPAEGLELLTAISNKLPWEVPGFCKSQESREISKKSSTCIDTKNLAVSKFDKICVFLSCGHYFQEKYHIPSDPLGQLSVVTVITKKAIVIKELGFMSRSITNSDKQPVYKISCTINVRKIEGVVTNVQVVDIEGDVPYQEEILFPMKLRCGQPLRLEANSMYLFTVVFSSLHPVYTLSCKDSFTTYCERSSENMTIKFKTPLHIRKIVYQC